MSFAVNKIFHLKTRCLVCFFCVLPLWIFAAEEEAAAPLYDIEVVNTFPHDRNAFTQGLTWHEGFLYESTGRNGQSGIRRVDLESGDLLQRQNLNRRYFGEGIAVMNDKIYQLTWQSHIGFVYNLEDFAQEKTFYLAGEGWGITHDGDNLIISDGTATLRFLDAETQQELRRLTVTYQNQPVNYLNELEYINGEIWANVWYQDIIVRIDPESGQVNSILNLSSLYPERSNSEEVLNGIAWDEAGQRLFVTGKLWPNLYEIKVLE